MVTYPSARRSVTPEELAFAAMFGLPAHVSAILAKLYASDEVSLRADRRHISELRAAMECEAIDTTSAGYRLTEQGRAECDRTLEEFRQWVATETRKSA